MFGKNIKFIRKSKNIGLNELSRLSGVNASYISALERDEKKNPSVTILEKLANALEVSIDEIMKADNITYSKLDKFNKNSQQIKKETVLSETREFKTAEDAMQFILKQPAIMGYGGFNIEDVSEDDLIELANDLLNQIELFGFKHKKK